jgi:predicted GNAT superfamily acetyltransferase
MEPVIRALTSDDELMRCVQLQRDTWGDDFRELVAPAVLLVVQKVGGLTLGAFDARGDLVGFVFGITGIRDRQPVHWSHMLAVRDDWRDRGLGRRLKSAQRTHLREMGVHTAYWSFDPLVARNAHVNLHCLGTTVIEYVRDMYGHNPTSRTDAVIGSDRFVVAWDVAGATPPPPANVDPGGPIVTLAGEPHPALPDTSPVLLEIPLDIQAVKQRDPLRAVDWRRLTRWAFEHYLSRGYRVADFRRGGPGVRGRYVLAAGGTRP